jgi:hypothetical protein
MLFKERSKLNKPEQLKKPNKPNYPAPSTQMCPLSGEELEWKGNLKFDLFFGLE